MIRIEQVSKNYGKKQVLNSINMELYPGKVYGVVGENGAGKTTLFKCISGLETYTGTISSTFDKLKDKLGLLPAEPFFFSKMTGTEYIRLLTNARQVKPENLAAKNIFDLPLDQYAATYSTGMKKKLALTAILLQENEVFVLDEPFNGVDIQSNLVITEIIKRLQALEKTIVISSHIFSTLAETCDEIFVLKGGSLVKHVRREDFTSLETEMKAHTIGNRIDRLDLK